jgi:hypothetical protein
MYDTAFVYAAAATEASTFSLDSHGGRYTPGERRHDWHAHHHGLHDEGEGSSQVTPSTSVHGQESWLGRQGHGDEDSQQGHTYTSSQYSFGAASQMTVGMEASQTSVALTDTSTARATTHGEQPSGMAALAAAVAAVASSQQARAAGPPLHHNSSSHRQVPAVAPQIIVIRSPVKVVSGPKVSTGAQTDSTAVEGAGLVTTSIAHATATGRPVLAHEQQAEDTGMQTAPGRKRQVAEMIRQVCAVHNMVQRQ